MDNQTKTTMFSSVKTDWETPQDFFDELNEEFHFNLDVCANETNHKCDNYFSEEQDGLKQSWLGYTSFCNPPYGRQRTEPWVRKAYTTMHEATNYDTVIVMLLPARTDTKWFHNYIYKNPLCKIRFIRGRLKFGDEKNSAPFPSMVVIFKF